MTEQITVESRLSTGLSRHWKQIHRHQLTAILARHREAERPSRGSVVELDQSLLDTLLEWVEVQRRHILQLHAEQQQFNSRLGHVLTEADMQAHIIDYARSLGAGPLQLWADRRAFRRWFGVDAVVERYQRKVADAERHLSFSLQRAGILAHAYLQDAAADRGELGVRWRRLKLELKAGPLLSYDGDIRVRLAAFRLLAEATKALPFAWHEQALPLERRNYIDRLALDTAQPVWLQVEALTLLDAIAYTELPAILATRLGQTSMTDDLFVRQHAVALIGPCQQRNAQQASDLWRQAAQDPSETVRQALVEQLVSWCPPQLMPLLPRLIMADPAAEVRGAGVYALIRLLDQDPARLEWVADMIERGVAEEANATVLRLYCHVLAAVAALPGVAADPASLQRWADRGIAALTLLHTQADEVRVRRWAALARETLWSLVDPAARQLRQQLQPWLSELPTQRRRRLLPSLNTDETLLGRVLSVLTQDDFGLDISGSGKRRYLRRWEKFGFRFWRAWFEFRRPAPDKRQAGRHTIGRLYYGLLQIPSARLAELSPTQVPGEPLHLSSEDGWRPYLPLVDQCISCLDQDWPTRPMRIFSSEGVTEITPPSGLWGRLKARTRLTFGFARYAELRNWQAGSGRDAAAYVKALQRLGFKVCFRPHTGLDGSPYPEDRTVRRFFPVFVFPGVLLETWGEYSRYFVSLYQNTLQQLIVFLGGMLTLFLGRHLVLNLRTRRARNALPLVIGGWGTRGKSGTERLKAALFNGLGFHVVAKTTGCEAMFLHSYSHGALREMYLFRPYDKATIWEQSGLVRLAARLDADVFLWECMGLTPAYVRILQQQWMRDDLATITNTYPDHEDLQGPAGIDIPLAMTEFIPADSVLITSEEQMLPILRHAAVGKGTECLPVSWIDSALLPRDVLARFPYEEHPANIALVLRLAEELGISRAFAIKAMADQVVPDVGVLQVYPEAELQGRRLQFTNGMSANERLGALGNWTRLGFDRQDAVAEPGVWVTTVINNRADRVARSQVFAEMLVRDITADCHVLIGSNLEGFMGYVEEAWARFCPQLTLWPDVATETVPQELWRRQAERLRVPVSAAAVHDRLSAMLKGVGVAVEVTDLDPDVLEERLHDCDDDAWSQHREAMLQVHRRNHEEWQEYVQLYDRLQQVAGPDTELDQIATETLWRWLRNRIHLLPSPTLGGEELLQAICTRTPPGYRNRIIGLQNIKGPGLDWVYLWQAWSRAHAAGQGLLTGKPAEVSAALRYLANVAQFDALTQAYLPPVLASVRELPLTQNEGMQAEIRLIEARLHTARAESGMSGKREQAETQGVWQPVLRAVESFLDVGDAIRRRRTANRIYRDLGSQRISSSRAAEELKALNKRQQGGWLLRRLSR